MLSYRRGLQPVQTQAHAGHPGSRHPGDHSLLLSGIHRQTTCSRSELRYADYYCDDHILANLYPYKNNHPDSDTFFDIDPDHHFYYNHHAHFNIDSQRHTHIYTHLDSTPHAHFQPKPNADNDIHIHGDVYIYRHSSATDFHLHTNSALI
jgi:hypothetical protein